MLERSSDHIEEVRKEDLFGIHGNRARLDLRQIENVGDEVQQVRARTMNRAGELHLFVRQVGLGILGELLAEDQNAVERRPQLMRHVGEELGLVL